MPESIIKTCCNIFTFINPSIDFCFMVEHIIYEIERKKDMLHKHLDINLINIK